MGRESLTQGSAWALLKCHTGVYVETEFPGGRMRVPHSPSPGTGSSAGTGSPGTGIESQRCPLTPRCGKAAAENTWLLFKTKGLAHLLGDLLFTPGFEEGFRLREHVGPGRAQRHCRQREGVVLYRLAIYSYSPLHTSSINIKKISIYKSMFFTHFLSTAVTAE